MLYFFHGTDGAKARERASVLIAALQEKKPEAELFRIEAENWNPLQFDELTIGQGLFSKTYLVQMVSLLENEDAREYICARVADIAASPNVFVLVEEKVDAATKRAILKYADRAQEFKNTEIGKEKFDVFSLADSLGRRDKKNLWVLYQHALAEDIAPEAINGILSWRARDMLANRPSPFWKTDELKDLSSRFVSLYHDSHRGKHELGVALERLILGL